MELDLRLVRDLTADDRRELREFREQFDDSLEPGADPLSTRLGWAKVNPDADLMIRVRVDGRLVSRVVVVERTVLVDGRPTRAGGISGVRTHPEFRRRGYASAAMRRATEVFWEHLRVELGLLLSSEMAVPFYRSLGWEAIDGPVLCERSDGGVVNYTEVKPQCPAMVLVPVGGRLPVGPIDVCGLPW